MYINLKIGLIDLSSQEVFYLPNEVYQVMRIGYSKSYVE